MAGEQIISTIIVVLIAAVFLGALLPTIADNTVGLNASEGGTTNISRETGAIIDLVPLLIAVGFIIGVLAAVGLKVTGKV